MKYPQITYDLLKSKNACDSQLELFGTHIGLTNSIELTQESALKYCNIFDIDWAAKNLLALDDLVEYNKVRDQALAECEKVRAPAWAEYNKVRAPAWAEYNKVRASTFVNLYSKVT